MITAVTRAVSPSLGDCELTWLPRQKIDLTRAEAQHRAYEDALRELGARVISLPALISYPDAVFVEDPAIVVDEAAVITSMGIESRRGERESLAKALATFRKVIRMSGRGTLEGGDAMRIGREIFVGVSGRTDLIGIAELRELLKPFGYRVRPVGLKDCLHLKSACCFIGDDTILINRAWVEDALFEGHRLIEVAEDEPGAANALRVGDTVLMPDAFPQTAGILRSAGFRVQELDLSELLKAESGVTCSSLIFDA
jgi:dimethylargininase